MREQTLKGIDNLIRHEFPGVKIIDHDAIQARKESERFGFSPYITLTDKGIKKEGEEILEECKESTLEAGNKYQSVLLNYLESQNCFEGKKTLIWRKRPELIDPWDRDGYMIYSRLMVI